MDKTITEKRMQIQNRIKRKWDLQQVDTRVSESEWKGGGRHASRTLKAGGRGGKAIHPKELWREQARGEACILKSIERIQEAFIKSIEGRRGGETCIVISIEGRQEACIKSIETIEKGNIGCLSNCTKCRKIKWFRDITVKLQSISTIFNSYFD